MLGATTFFVRALDVLEHFLIIAFTAVLIFSFCNVKSWSPWAATNWVADILFRGDRLVPDTRVVDNEHGGLGITALFHPVGEPREAIQLDDISRFQLSGLVRLMDSNSAKDGIIIAV